MDIPDLQSGCRRLDADERHSGIMLIVWEKLENMYLPYGASLNTDWEADSDALSGAYIAGSGETCVRQDGFRLSVAVSKRREPSDWLPFSSRPRKEGQTHSGINLRFIRHIDESYWASFSTYLEPKWADRSSCGEFVYFWTQVNAIGVKPKWGRSSHLSIDCKHASWPFQRIQSTSLVYLIHLIICFIIELLFSLRHPNSSSYWFCQLTVDRYSCCCYWLPLDADYWGIIRFSVRIPESP